jgi:hypothetical protein
VKAQKTAGAATFVMRDVEDVSVRNSFPLADERVAKADKKQLE